MIKIQINLWAYTICNKKIFISVSHPIKKYLNFFIIKPTLLRVYSLVNWGMNPKFSNKNSPEICTMIIIKVSELSKRWIQIIWERCYARFQNSVSGHSPILPGGIQSDICCEIIRSTLRVNLINLFK